jgi:S1-C subfamily serine protease
LIGRDPNNDLALLKADGTFTAAMWAAENSIKVGHLVLALGRPVGDLQATLGVVSAIVGKDHLEPEEHHGRHFRRMRRRMWGHALADGFIRTDVVMYPGFSGGPLVSSYGTVYGLNTSGFTRGASLTVPVGTIRKSVEALMKHGKVRQGYLGVGVQAVRLPENIGDRETGVLIISVERDSPAQQAGLLVGDIIVAIGDETVEEVEELLRALHGEVVGKEVAVQIVRGGQLKTVSVTIGERA